MRRLTRSGLVAALALGLVALVPLTASAEDAIPKDTVLVHVSKDGKPLAAQTIKVIGVPPGGGEVSYGEQKTDAQGVATFHIPFRPGLVLTAYTTYEGVQYKGPEGSYAGSPKFGLALTLKVFEKSAGGATLDDLSFGPQSHLVAELGDDYLDFTEVLSVVNGSQDTYDPKGGLVIPLPTGFYDVNGVNGKPVYTVDGVGARAPGPFLPGRTQVVVTFKVPHAGHHLAYDQPLKIKMGTTQAIIEDAKDLKVTGPAVMGQDTRSSEGRQFRAVQLSTNGGNIAFTLDGLPHRTYRSRWVAAGLAGFLVLMGFVMALGGGKERSQDRAFKASLEAERDELLADLEQLERDKKDGSVGDDDYREDRQEILDRLANVLRSLER